MNETSELADFIRKSSQAGKMLSQADLEVEFGGQAVSVSDPSTEPVQFSVLVQNAILSHNDIKVIRDDTGCAWYFSERFMTCAYAEIMLLKGMEPLKMIAAVIREHSRRYPRPVPLSLFRYPPFNLRHEDILCCLNEMKNISLYRDIAHVTTSIGNLFAFSTDHLDPGHATMLAEWADVGQAENP